MSGAADKTIFPERGDNFVTLGPWRILTGATWHSMQQAAEEAHVRAARAVADELGALRAARRAQRLKLEGPRPVPSLGQGPAR